jgi:Acyl-CoA dehydrogenase, C-terminal domain
MSSLIAPAGTARPDGADLVADGGGRSSAAVRTRTAGPTMAEDPAVQAELARAEAAVRAARAFVVESAWAPIWSHTDHPGAHAVGGHRNLSVERALWDHAKSWIMF